MINTFRERSRSLTFRIAGLLAIALLPVGLISVATTYQLLDRADRDLADTLLALTSDAAAEQEAAIRTATGVAKTVVTMIPVLREAGYPCEQPMSALLRDTPELSFIGYVGRNGDILCASDAMGSSLAERPLHKEFVDNPGPRVKFSLRGSISQTSVIVVSLPVINGGDYDGYVVASLPHRSLTTPTITDEEAASRPLELITFNGDGEVLTSSSDATNLSANLPANRSLRALAAGGSEVAFIAENARGQRRVFALVPIVQGQVYALGSWQYRRNTVANGMSFGTSMLFPLLMWLVSLLVAFYAVQRMVIKPTRNLRARMLQFMRSRKLVEPRADRRLPTEIRDMEETWMRLAENILHDEAELYDTIHQRTVLLKEVHHRVKNNLQLIVSILGMKIRKARTPAIKSALGDIQQRVMSIARVHQNLYETSTAERVRAGELLQTIVAQMVKSAQTGDSTDVRLEAHYDDCEVYPDQAVPLSLAVSELVTNALKHMGPTSTGETPVIEVRLDCAPGTDRGVVTVRNTLALDREEPEDDVSTGLGEQLVRAFVGTMEAKVTRDQTDTHYSVVIDFPIHGFDAEIIPSDHTHPPIPVGNR
ncbi:MULTISPECIES: sensor histidine kinase [Maritimibacter]|uniref:histidine kinase n=1 Tax=Maritimibacter alkaliphilus HTCC2654 TaxID=314271 RepID=A3VFR5_9RHOB|nr:MULTISPECIES: sensor histidine kinase [Maritimibacter]EAQ13180.1 periplasmic sensor signal transduction histidine kinase [Rhodobacterales bacterium HTCC2654] [Maritimibacter alkaliphilus HTCC2654]MBL6428125.1 sensor histidine kinase [Maritimibacter sp.]TYP83950.1 two-component sensor histidine kinase [Maritimibacter alkaliphilus HTCC2654]